MIFSNQRTFICTDFISLMAYLTILASKIQADTGNCGGVTLTVPFTDVGNSSLFCQIAATYFSGLTNGIGATTFSPTENVTRKQIAVFVSLTLDYSVKCSPRSVVDESTG
jgi:hypothetical protein